MEKSRPRQTSPQRARPQAKPTYGSSKARAQKKESALRRGTRAMKKKFRVFSIRSGLDMPFLFLTLTLVAIGLKMCIRDRRWRITP